MGGGASFWDFLIFNTFMWIYLMMNELIYFFFSYFVECFKFFNNPCKLSLQWCKWFHNVFSTHSRDCWWQVILSTRFVYSPLVQFQLLHSKYHLCGPATRGLILSTYIKFVNLFPEIKSTIQDVSLLFH